ncbi:MAG: hypothetical protein DRI32_09525 [Chloroflexi bacterium]|nr:MAG: hypothetical protein DRI32_09525 [Chloroflexota bacterium]
MYKKNHPQLDAYFRNELPQEAQIAVAKHIADCEICRKSLEKREETRLLLREASEKPLQPAGRLRLYEKLNEERKKRGEKLLGIPVKLIAQVKAKGGTAASAVGDIAKAGGQSASRIGARSGQIVHTMAEGTKSVGETALDAGKKSAHHGKDMVDEAGQTMFDAGRVMTSEVADVISDTMEHPLKAVFAPARLAGKGIKAGVRTMKGSTKIAASGVKGTVSVVKGGLDVGAESIRQSGETLGAMIDTAEGVLEERNKVASAIGDGMQKIEEAKPVDDE